MVVRGHSECGGSLSPRKLIPLTLMVTTTTLQGSQSSTHILYYLPDLDNDGDWSVMLGMVKDSDPSPSVLARARALTCTDSANNKRNMLILAPATNGALLPILSGASHRDHESRDVVEIFQDAS